MDHAQFKARQTAAVYVAEGLDEQTLEAFEMHMMGCSECVEDVETWRAIKLNIPRRARPTRTAATLPRSTQAAMGWRMAASVLVAGLTGAAGGWFGHESTVPNLDSGQATFFNVPATSRGGDCTSLRFGPQTKFAFLRISGVSRDRRVVAADAEKRELPASRYSSRLQDDGSHIVRIDAQALVAREVSLEARASDGSGEPLGCVAGDVISRH
jgi:hypothetical protein